jgi:hypothetical protein
MYDESDINVAFQAAMEDLFYRYGVDVYFAGHRHYYSRNYPTYAGIVDPAGYDSPKATTYITAGGSGNDEMSPIARKLAQQADTTAREAAGADGEPGVERPVNNEPADHSMQLAPGQVQGEPGPWNVKSDKQNHVGATKVTIINDSEMRIDYLRTKGGVGELWDTVTLTRDHSAGAFPQELPPASAK